MNNIFNVAIILGGAIVLSVGLYIYFSPYHSCVRGNDSARAEIICARMVGGG